MNDLQIELTRLIGKKELTFGCLVIQEDGYCHTITRSYDDVCEGIESCCGRFERIQKSKIKEIIGNPATLSDLHRYMNEKHIGWKIHSYKIEIIGSDLSDGFPYDSSKDLLDQDEGTLKQIIELIKSKQS